MTYVRSMTLSGLLVSCGLSSRVGQHPGQVTSVLEDHFKTRAVVKMLVLCFFLISQLVQNYFNLSLLPLGPPHILGYTSCLTSPALVWTPAVKVTFLNQHDITLLNITCDTYAFKTNMHLYLFKITIKKTKKGNYKQCIVM